MKNTGIAFLLIIIMILLFIPVYRVFGESIDWVEVPSPGVSKEIAVMNGMLFALTDNNLFKSSDMGETWQGVPIGFYTGMLHALDVDSGKLYVASANGVAFSTDAGNSFKWSFQWGWDDSMDIDFQDDYGWLAIDMWGSKSGPNFKAPGKKWQLKCGNISWSCISMDNVVIDPLMPNNAAYISGICNYRTNDGGNIWLDCKYRVLFATVIDGTVYIFSSQHFSRDRGDTWEPLGMSANAFVKDETTGYFFAAHSNGGLYVGIPGRMNLLGLSTTTVQALAVCNGYLFASSKDGKIYRAQIPSDSTPTRLEINRTHLNFGATTSGMYTQAQTFNIENAGGGILAWEINSSASWLTCTPTSGTMSQEITVSVNPSGLSVGTYNAVISISEIYNSDSPKVIDVILNVFQAGATTVPFGIIDTPIDGAIVEGSVPVSGWALDDIEVANVKIYNDQTYIGDAIFVEGARPDVEQAYPSYPLNHKAGWGYMLLTNFLPDQGNGTFVLYAVATDTSGQTSILGSKIITSNNANAAKPFGAIDTPQPGGTAVGNNFLNQGWALTPLPNTIPTDGSTITVWVDGIPLTHPVYNQYRPDIAELFPYNKNSNGAAGYFYLDSTRYENGVHIIAWSVGDDAGNVEGIGSRFFLIKNLGKNTLNTCSQNSAAKLSSDIPIDYLNPVIIKKGYNPKVAPLFSFPGDNGIIAIEINELERLEIQLNDCFTEVGKNKKGSSNLYCGYMQVGDILKTLPIGSLLIQEKGFFYWQPGPGFVGKYHLVFMQKDQQGKMTQKNILVNIKSKFSRKKEETEDRICQ